MKGGPRDRAQRASDRDAQSESWKVYLNGDNFVLAQNKAERSLLGEDFMTTRPPLALAWPFIRFS